MAQAFKKRNIWVILIFLIATFGLYAIYWFYITNNELKKIDSKAPPSYIGIIVTPLLILTTFTIVNIFNIKELYFELSKNLIFIIILIILYIIAIFYYVFYFRSAYRSTDIDQFRIIVCFVILFPYLMIIYLQSCYNKTNIFNIPPKEINEEKKKEILKNEENCKNYINEHKKNFSKSSIKKQLIKTSISEEEVDIYLNKYYN